MLGRNCYARRAPTLGVVTEVVSALAATETTVAEGRLGALRWDLRTQLQAPGRHGIVTPTPNDGSCDDSDSLTDFNRQNN